MDTKGEIAAQTDSSSSTKLVTDDGQPVDGTNPLPIEVIGPDPLPVDGPLTDDELRAETVQTTLTDAGGDPINDTNPLAVKITDGTDIADIVENVGGDTNLDGTKGLVTNSILYLRDGDGVVKPAKMDLITHEQAVMQHEHHEMHEGHHYFIKTYVSNGVGAATDYFAFTTPNTTTRIHAKSILAPDVDYVLNIYEDATITGGTPVVGINNDRDSGNSPELVTVAAPTVTVPGTLIWAARTGGGKDPVGVAPGLNYEIIAKTNSTYVFELIKQITSTTAVADLNFWWYEHVPKS